MCGRFSCISTPGELAERFSLEGIRAGVLPRYNIAPTDEVAVAANSAPHVLDVFRWGLVPFWSKDTSPASRLINAALETLTDRPAFRIAWRKRCLIFADGFYEWHEVRTQRRAVYVRRRDQAPFAFAGIWDSWRSEDGHILKTCAIVTVPASAKVAPVNRRMPALLNPRLFSPWLSPKPTSIVLWQQLLSPQRDEALELFPVSRYVNKTGNEGPECIAPSHELFLAAKDELWPGPLFPS